MERAVFYSTNTVHSFHVWFSKHTQFDWICMPLFLFTKISHDFTNPPDLTLIIRYPFTYRFSSTNHSTRMCNENLFCFFLTSSCGHLFQLIGGTEFSFLSYFVVCRFYRKGIICITIAGKLCSLTLFNCFSVTCGCRGTYFKRLFLKTFEYFSWEKRIERYHL